MAYELLQNKKELILPNLNNRKKRFLTTILGTIATKVVNLAFEGISSFLHYKQHKALQKVVNVLNSRKGIDHNRVYHLEDTMLMYGKYNSDTLMELVNTVHQMQNVMTCYLLSFLMTTIVFSCLIIEVNLRNTKNTMLTMNVMKNSSMENFHLDCLDQLILVVHLPDVSVTNTNYLL